jgi:hypothetical protein
MGDRRAQEFWDRIWLWEKYELFPTESVDDPHLVVQLSSDVEAAGGNVDPELFSRYDHCVGRVLQRLTDEFPNSVDGLDEAELKHWLKFGLRHDVRGHDEAITPIVDADSLVVFRFFVTHALQYAARHKRTDLQALWQKVAEIAKQVDDEHRGVPKSSRFEARVGSLLSGVTAR